MIYTSAARAIELVNRGELNNPFMAWNNAAKGKTYTGTTTLADGARANAFFGTTYDYWRPDVTGAIASLVIDMGVAVACDFAGIAAHNLDDFGATVTVEHSPDGTTWTDCGTGAVASDEGPVCVRFAQVARRYWRVRAGGLTAGDDIAVGVIYIGAEMILPRRFYQGFSPVITQTEVQLQSNVSVGGNLLGSTVVATGSTLSAELKNIDPAFIRGADFKGFMQSFARGTPFFFGWRPHKYPQDVHFCWREGGVIRPTNEGPRDLMAFMMDCRVYDG